jgi:hypothetical protein
VAPADRLVRFLESRLAAAVADRPAAAPDRGARLTATADPDMTAVNAAFALALVERHDLVGEEHRLYDLAHAADDDAETVSMTTYQEHFRSLSPDTDERTYRERLVEATRDYAARPQVAN